MAVRKPKVKNTIEKRKTNETDVIALHLRYILIS